MRKVATIHERITQMVKVYGGGKNTVFANLIGESEANIRGYRSNIVPKYPFFEKVASSLDISTDWLLTGRGDMMKSTQSIPKDEQTNVVPAVRSTEDKGIPLIPLEAVAGVMSDNNMQLLKYECEYYHVPLFKNADFLMQVTGDSMQPKYYSGDIVACRKVFIGTFFQWNRVHVIDTNQGVVIKRVKKGTDASYITLVSENTDYDPFEVALNDIYSIALVVGVVRAE